MSSTFIHNPEVSGSTKPLKNRLAVVFDFDDTLAPDTLEGLLNFLEIDVEHFRQKRIQPLEDVGWDSAAARAYCLIKESQRRPENDKITYSTLSQFGQQIQPFPGIQDTLKKLRRRAQELSPEVELEFYIVTGGFGDIIRHTAIAPYFEHIWGCEFAYNEKGEIEFLKRAITHTEKTRYLMQISSGQDTVDGTGRAFAYRDAPTEDLRIPLSQFIYVGDGVSDVPCFSLLNDKRGVGIGVFKGDSDDEWGQEVTVSESQRVANIAKANYQENSEMRRSLMLAVESICKQIELHQLSIGQ
jgi:phosphoglycolate phosphatase-like HAD superfamily hydrolase